MSKAIFVGLIAAGVAALVVATTAVGAPASSDSTYVVLYQQQAIAGNAAATMQQAGGSLLYAYPAIGVAIARSSSPSFRDDLLKSSAIENVASTDGFAVKLPDVETSDSSGTPALPNAPASDSDNLSPLQWDMREINAPQAHAITGGSPSVLVGDIDTGIDFSHPDLAPNIDVADSANCVSGAPVQGTAAQDDNGHGTHTAGTIAAASNGVGIVGVAPNVKIAGSRRATQTGSSSLRPSSARSCGRRRITSTSPTTATSRIRSCSTARTTRSNGRSGPRSRGRSSTPSTAASPSSPPTATSPRTWRIRRRT